MLCILMLGPLAIHLKLHDSFKRYVFVFAILAQALPFRLFNESRTATRK